MMLNRCFQIFPHDQDTGGFRGCPAQVSGQEKVERENSLAKGTSGKSQDTTEEGESSGYIKKGDFRRMKRQREEEEAAYELSGYACRSRGFYIVLIVFIVLVVLIIFIVLIVHHVDSGAEKGKARKQPSLSQNGSDPYLSFKHPVQGQWSDISEFYGISKISV